MKTTLSIICVMALMMGSLPGAESKKTESPLQIQFDVRILEGDPLGSIEAGSIRVVSRPTIRTLEKQEFGLTIGVAQPVPAGDEQFVDYGIEITGKVKRVTENTLLLDVALTDTRLDESAKQSESRLELVTEGTRVISTVKFSELMKYRIGKRNDRQDQQRWAEFTARLIESDDAN